MPIIVNNISKSFSGKNAVNNISFKLNDGKIFGLLGPNGSGKTTIIRIILGILQSENGSVSWNDKNISGKLKNKIGYLPEERGLYQNSKVKDALKYFYELRFGDKNLFEERLNFWSQKLEATALLDERIENLSKGNQQLIQFLTTVLHEPDFVILDEPFSGFDPINQKNIVEAIKLLAERGKIILVSTHQLNFAEQLCGDLLLIKDGNEIFTGQMNELKRLHGNSFYEIELNDADVLIKERAKIIKRKENSFTIELPNDLSPSDFLRTVSRNAEVTGFIKTESRLDEIFLSLISEIDA